jgi:hypothetical protein
MSIITASSRRLTECENRGWLSQDADELRDALEKLKRASPMIS